MFFVLAWSGVAVHSIWVLVYLYFCTRLSVYVQFVVTASLFVKQLLQAIQNCDLRKNSAARLLTYTIGVGKNSSGKFSLGKFRECEGKFRDGKISCGKLW